ncbi:MAG: sodium:proton antiporter [Lachnospiraceae bacterium]|nr:sodium:proton antiporter [Lachnospiraceae bacterium]
MSINFLFYTVLILFLVVIIGFVNEKVTKLTYEISLMLFSIAVAGVIALIAVGANGNGELAKLKDMQLFDVEKYLMNGVLCFMLFAGSCHMKLSDFKRLARPIGVLSVICTLLGAIFYGGLFYGVAKITGMPFSLPMCLMFGSIVAPTDPIAATSILNKFGLPKDTGFIIEGESLLNDGVGVALFVCFSGMVTQDAGEGFFAVMFREILGAVIIGAAVTLLFHVLFLKTQDGKRRIYISLLTVAMAYWLCEIFSCSGAIASVVCGVLFSTLRGINEDKNGALDLQEFDGFWEILDSLLNSILYVILGLTFIRILQMPHVIVLSVFAIICNLLGRFGSLFVSTFIIGKLPDGYGRVNFCSLLTWGGLRGGLSIALAMSTNSMLPDDIYHIVLGCTYAIVFFTTVIQGLSMKRVYSLLSA